MDQSVKQKTENNMECLMEEYKKLATPGARHRVLASRAGSWEVKSKHWMESGKPPVESEATCERKMVLDGHYLQEDFKGEVMGGPFSGLGITGYDNHKKKYVSIWLDSMSTGIYYFEGKGSEDGKTITLEGNFDDPVRGPMSWHLVTKVQDSDHETFEMRMISRSGKIERSEMVYTRRA